MQVGLKDAGGARARKTPIAPSAASGLTANAARRRHGQTVILDVLPRLLERSGAIGWVSVTLRAALQ